MENNNNNNYNYSDIPQRDGPEYHNDMQSFNEWLDDSDSFNPVNTVKEVINDKPLGNYNEKYVRTGENIEPGSDEDIIRQQDILDSPGMVENIKESERYNEDLRSQGQNQVVKEELAKDEQLYKEDFEKQEQYNTEERARQDLQEQERVAAEEQQAREAAAAAIAATQTQPEPEATPEHVEQAPEPQELPPVIEPESTILTYEQAKMWELYGSVHHQHDLKDVRFKEASFLQKHLKNIDEIIVVFGDDVARLESKSQGEKKDIKVTYSHDASLYDKERAVRVALESMVQELNRFNKPGEPIDTSAVTLKGSDSFMEIATRELDKINFAIERSEFKMPNGSEPYRQSLESKENIIGAAQAPVEAAPSVFDKVKDGINELKDIAKEKIENNSISGQAKEPALEEDGPVAFEDMSPAEQARINAEMEAHEREGEENAAAELEAADITDEDRFGIQAQNKETEAPQPGSAALATGLLLETSRQAHAQELKAEQEQEQEILSPALEQPEPQAEPEILSPAEKQARAEAEAKKNEPTYVDRIHSGEYTSFSEVNKNHPEALLTPASFKLVQERKLNPLEPKQEGPKKPQRERSNDIELGM